MGERLSGAEIRLLGRCTTHRRSSRSMTGVVMSSDSTAGWTSKEISVRYYGYSLKKGWRTWRLMGSHPMKGRTMGNWGVLASPAHLTLRSNRLLMGIVRKGCSASQMGFSGGGSLDRAPRLVSEILGSRVKERISLTSANCVRRDSRTPAISYPPDDLFVDKPDFLGLP